MKNGKRKKHSFYYNWIKKKTDYTKQDHSFTSPEPQMVIKMRENKKGKKMVCMQVNQCSY
jgi:hypothetical protein